MNKSAELNRCTDFKLYLIAFGSEFNLNMPCIFATLTFH